MSDSQLTVAQQAEIAALNDEWDREVVRTAVDMKVALPRLVEVYPTEERQMSETGFEVSYAIDTSGIVATLRTLADCAGTEAFVVAYNAGFTGVKT